MRHSGPIKKNSDTICSCIVDHVKVLLHICCTFYVPCSEFICKLFNIESMGDNSFQNDIVAFCCGVMVQCCAFLHSVAY